MKMGMRGMRGIWRDMGGIYRKMGLSESEIVERILCKTTRCLNGRLHLDECDEKS
jgi:hypothetical protein